MQSRIKAFLTYGLYWVVFCVVARIIFLIYHFDNTSELAFTDVLLINLHGLRLDLSLTGYLMLIPGVLFIIGSFFRGHIQDILLKVYTCVILFLASFIVVADLELYKHWEFRLDATPLMYLGKEAAGSGDPLTTIILVIFWLILFSLFGFIYLKIVSPKVKNMKASNWKTSLVMLIISGCLIAPIRGTTGVAPINSGTVYFHDSNLFANHAAVNVVWNTGYALNKLNRLKYPEGYFDPAKTQAYFSELYDTHGGTPKIINNERPNVMIIVLESYTFRFIEPLGGKPGITPNINELVKEGILFDNFYSSGDRTDKGIISILNGYPTQPKSSIIKFPKKTQSLPYLNKNLKQLGYYTGFTYGYNIDYANFRSYLTNAQFDHVTHSKDWPDSLNTSKWGVHDHFVFNRFFEEANAMDSPFFKIMMTQSSHEPFTVPMETVIKGEDEVSQFLNSAYYTDKSLGEFITKAKQTDWWKNTWVIITADHGHGMPDNHGIDNPNRFKIPMVWLGGAINAKDTVIHSYANQTDIANTVLAQLDKPDPNFKFSNDILNSEYDDFAIFVFNNGFGYLNDGTTVVYNNTGGKYLRKEGIESQKDLEMGKAYMQVLYNDFNQR